MADEPDNIVLRRLRDIRATLDEHSRLLQALPRIEKQLSGQAKLAERQPPQSGSRLEQDV